MKLFDSIRKGTTTVRGDGLAARVAKGTVLIGAASVGERLLRLARNMLLARVLMPDALGVAAIVFSVSSLFEVLTDLGVRRAIVHDAQGANESFLNSAWWLSVGRSLVLYGAGFLLCPFVADFYKMDELTPLIRLCLLAVVFGGAISPFAYADLKKVVFKRWVVVFNVGSSVGIGCAVLLAIVYKSVWSLVVGFVVESAARTTISHLLFRFRPKFQFDKDAWRALGKYARGMLGIPALYYLFMQTDTFVLGKMLPARQLGLYSMVVTLARTPLEFMASLVDQVLMPAFSEMQGRTKRLSDAVIQSTAPIVWVGLPALAVVALYPSELLRVVYGQEYVLARAPFVIAFAAELLRVSSTPISTVYLATGQPGMHRLFTILRAAIMILSIYPAVKLWGLTGAAACILCAQSIGYVAQIAQARRMMALRVWKYLSLFVAPLLLSSAITAGVWLMARSWGQTHLVGFLALGLGSFLLSLAAAVAAGNWRRIVSRLRASTESTAREREDAGTT